MLNLDNDSFNNIIKCLKFCDQLNLRATCTLFIKNIKYYNYNNSNFMKKVQNISHYSSMLSYEDYDKKPKRFFMIPRIYDCNKLIYDISLLMTMEYLKNLLTLGIYLKSNIYLANRYVSYKNLQSICSDTENYYIKFNKDMSEFFESNNWSKVVKKCLIGKIKLNCSFSDLKSSIGPIISDGNKIKENLNLIRYW